MNEEVKNPLSSGRGDFNTHSMISICRPQQGCVGLPVPVTGRSIPFSQIHLKASAVTMTPSVSVYI